MSVNIPLFPPDNLLDESGKLHPVWHSMFSQLLQELSGSLTENGFAIPQKPTADISSLSGKVANGFLVADSDTNELKVHLNGAFKTITAT